MYGQLKSTVNCLTCGHVSITFDPFLNLALPIARPFKLNVILIPYDYFIPIPEDEREKDLPFKKKNCQHFCVPLNKEHKIMDLKRMVGELGNLKPPG